MEDVAPPQPSLPGDTDAEALLQQMASGDEEAGERLFLLVYKELHRVARSLMQGERKAHTLQTTALVNEAWLRLAPAATSAESKAQFFGLAARAMRRVLVDHARRRGAQKRDGGKRNELFDGILQRWDGEPSDLLALDEALETLRKKDDELRRIVELRFFAGLTLEETGNLLGLTVRQVHRRWTFARGWLRDELGRGGALDG